MSSVRRRPRWVTILLGTILASAVAGVAIVAVVAVETSPTRTKQPAAAPLPVPATSAVAGESRLPGPLPSAPVTPVTTVTASPTEQTGLGPSSIRIPSLGVTATIGQAAVIKGVLTPPRVPTEVGAWGGSASLDATSGEVTIAGHVNWAAMAPFAFGHLADLAPGALIYTTGTTATQTAWRVTSVTARPKSEPIDAAAFAGTQAPRRLALITCGGAFDAASSSYDDNVYVYATPVAL